MSQTNLVSLLVEDKIVNSTSLASANKLVKYGVNVHKFGGSSFASTTCIERVINIIRQRLVLKTTQVKIKGII